MHPKKIKEAFSRGENITSLLKKIANNSENTEEFIETAYDLQSGSYVKLLDSPEHKAHKELYGKAIAAEILSLTDPGSIVEAGIGEGTTFSHVIKNMDNSISHAHGFDIAWSRIATCRNWLERSGMHDMFLSVASLLHTPYLDSSFDVVYTSHTIEPNGGSEEQILHELYRITSRYLVLLEPGYELASPEAQARMKEHGYCRNLAGCAEKLGMKVVKHELFSQSINPMNPTALIVIEKNPDAESAVPKLACPRFGDPLEDFVDALYSEVSLRAYPKIRGIPCLREMDGIIASAYNQFTNS